MMLLTYPTKRLYSGHPITTYLFDKVTECPQLKEFPLNPDPDGGLGAIV
jgi:hypothetical protein